jgi:hypothetical protein
MPAKLAIVKPSSTAEKATRTTVDTVLLTPDLVKTWKVPPFQRECVITGAKCQDVTRQIASDGGVLPGVITLGRFGSDIYRVDGNHRLQCYLATGLPEGYADVRTVFCANMAEMADEFVRLNSSLRRMTPDDVLRGLEASYPLLRAIREECPFVGYDKTRRSEKGPILSMSMVIRIWRGSATEVPVTGNSSASSMATTLTDEEAQQLITFVTLCYEAWGRDREYARLWGGLNSVLCGWLYRRMVLSQWSPKTPRLSRDLFRKCLMSVSADSHYLDWLVGRNTGERDRSPAYARLRKIFAERLAQEMGKRPSMPSPPWFLSNGGGK